MQKSLSKEVFERIGNLSNRLKMETVQFVNQASVSVCDSPPSDDSVIMIEGPETETNSFVKLLKEEYENLKKMKSDLDEDCEKKCLDILLEDLVNISVYFHTCIEDSIEVMCKKISLEPEEYKSPLDDSIPVSLFQSKAKEKAFGKISGLGTKKIPEINEYYIQDTEEKKHYKFEGKDDKVDSNSFQVNLGKNKFSVNDLPESSEKVENIDLIDLKNLGLSEETRKLLGIN